MKSGTIVSTLCVWTVAGQLIWAQPADGTAPATHPVRQSLDLDHIMPAAPAIVGAAPHVASGVHAHFLAERLVRGAEVAPQAAPLSSPQQLAANSFAAFYRDNNAIAFSSIAGIANVADESAFNEMKTYFQRLYGNLAITGQNAIGDISYYCIPVAQQPALRGTNGTVDTPPSPDPDSAVEPSILGYTDKNCPSGSVPLNAVSLTQMSQSSTLADYLAQGSSEGLAGPRALKPPILAPQAAEDGSASDTLPHRWALIYQLGNVNGLSADLSVWNPSVAANQMSLSQLWVVADGIEGSPRQTVEAGWHVYAPYFGKSVTPFVFSTQKNYTDVRCYNLDCAKFVQVTSQPVFATFAPARLSQLNGLQSTVHVVWYKKSSSGNWWLKMNGVWVGYYPANLFTNGVLSGGTSYVEVGGETASTHPDPQMGSGEFAAGGYQKAAFDSSISYWDAKGTKKDVDGQVVTTEPSCYSLTYETGTAPSTGTYMYYGGPGAADPSCKAAQPPN